jgi:hypothetical protein
MITFRQDLDTGFVEIAFSSGLGPLHGAKLSFAKPGDDHYRPCAIFRGTDADRLLESSFWDWNQAVQFGNVKFSGMPWPVYWNLFLNQLHEYKGTVRLRVEVLKAEGIEVFDRAVALESSRAVYLTDWSRWLPEGGPWKVSDNRLMWEEGKENKPLCLKPGLAGRYAVYVGVPYGIVTAWLKASDEPNRYPFCAQANRAEFQDKANKELFWKTVDLKPGSALEIRPLPLTIREPKVWPFGSIGYLKLVPVPAPTRAAAKPSWRDKTLALYFEPYSWAYVYDLRERWQVKEALSLYQELGADEIHNQIIRFGSKALHHSRVAEAYDEGEAFGDDGTFNREPSAMVMAMDILRESIDICRELGMAHYANAGLTNCYPGTDFEDKIAREHPEWKTDNWLLRFGHAETRAYAAGVIQEFAAWGTDGVSVDCMRYPYHHTEEELLLLFREIRRAMNKLPLTARIPAGDIVYYRAFQALAREGTVQCVIPSNLMMQDPEFSLKPYIKWKDYGCKVFGLIDGWKTHVGNFHNFQLSLNRNPGDIRRDITRFFNEGADGIFVYQADGHLADAFTGKALNWRIWAKETL